MTGLFHEGDVPELDLSDHRVNTLLDEIKRNSRNRRIAMVAPLALAAAVVATLMAGPQRYGGLDLVSEAEASGNELPRVFGANGVWRLAEPIAESPTDGPGPAAIVRAPAQPASPNFVLTPPSDEDLYSLPASASTPPTPTLGQSLEAEEQALDELDWSRLIIAVQVADDAAPESEAPPVEGPDEPTAETQQSSTPDVAADAEATTTPALSSPDEDVTVAGDPQPEPTGDAAQGAADAVDPNGANPSTPPTDPANAETAPSAPATIVQRPAVVHSAHVSVTVQVVDDDSSVIDWCNTRVDWGDGSVTWVTDVDEDASCAAACELEATSSTVGINEEITFTHEYTTAIDASPRVFVATGDGCSYTLAELQLSPFSVVPYY